MENKELVAKIVQLQSQAADIEEAIKNYKAKLAEQLGNIIGEEIVGDNDTGFTKVIVYQHKTFNEAWGKKLAPELWEKAKRTKEYVDSAGAKALLTPEEYAVFQKPSDGLSVKLENIND